VQWQNIPQNTTICWDILKVSQRTLNIFNRGQSYFPSKLKFEILLGLWNETIFVGLFTLEEFFGETRSNRENARLLHLLNIKFYTYLGTFSFYLNTPKSCISIVKFCHKNPGQSGSDGDKDCTCPGFLGQSSTNPTSPGKYSPCHHRCHFHLDFSDKYFPMEMQLLGVYRLIENVPR